MKILTWMTFTLAGSAVAIAQIPAASKIEFEAATVRPAAPRDFSGGPMGGPGTPDPGRITCAGMALKGLLMVAYDVRFDQVDAGPSWLETERYDITATLPAGATRDQIRPMLQNLLADRFKLVLRRITKEVPLFELVVTKNGSKLKPAGEHPAASSKEAGPGPKTDSNGFPEPPAGLTTGYWTMMSNGRVRMTFRGQTVAQLAKMLGERPDLIDRPVVDKSGLTGKYDFHLEFAPGDGGRRLPGQPPPAAIPANPPESQADAPPGIFTALEEQLGLKLESRKGPLDVLVVERAEKPGSN